MQSLPKRLRSTVVVSPGRVLVAADYSSADFRPAAAMSGDIELVELFNRGQDPYREIGTLAGPAARGREREVGKLTALAALYGASAWSLQSKTGLPAAAVETMVKGYMNRFPTLWRWREVQIQRMRTGRGIRNPWGRVLMPETESETINHLCQSAAADLVKTAMLRLQDELPRGAVLVAQIHDELLVECGEDDAEDVANIMRVEMTRPVPQLPVALAVKIGVGRSWAEATQAQR